jgi:hypothetical protein
MTDNEIDGSDVATALDPGEAIVIVAAQDQLNTPAEINVPWALASYSTGVREVVCRRWPVLTSEHSTDGEDGPSAPIYLYFINSQWSSRCFPGNCGMQRTCLEIRQIVAPGQERPPELGLVPTVLVPTRP